MKAVVQRVRSAAVLTDGETVSAIGPGLFILLGVARGDTPLAAERLASRVEKLRIFEDDRGRMSEPAGDREFLCVSQFTLMADTAKGNRPSFLNAAPGEDAEPLYELFCETLGAKRGSFGRHMDIELELDGPVTIELEA